MWVFFESVPSYLLFTYDTDDCNLIFDEVVIRFLLRHLQTTFHD